MGRWLGCSEIIETLIPLLIHQPTKTGGEQQQQLAGVYSTGAFFKEMADPSQGARFPSSGSGSSSSRGGGGGIVDDVYGDPPAAQEFGREELRHRVALVRRSVSVLFCSSDDVIAWPEGGRRRRVSLISLIPPPIVCTLMTIVIVINNRWRTAPAGGSPACTSAPPPTTAAPTTGRASSRRSSRWAPPMYVLRALLDSGVGWLGMEGKREGRGAAFVVVDAFSFGF